MVWGDQPASKSWDFRTGLARARLLLAKRARSPPFRPALIPLRKAL